MRYLLFALLLSLLWCALWFNWSGVNLAFGFVLSLPLLYLMQPVLGPTVFFRKSFDLIDFVITFIKELFVSSITVAKIVIKPCIQIRSGIIQVPTFSRDPVENTVLANVITLTPGTLSIDLPDHQRYIYVHCMNLTSTPTQEAKAMHDGLGRKVHKMMSTTS